MKKTLLLLVALITATIAFAQTEINGIYYNLNNSNQTAEVTSGSNKYSGDITIPEKITYNATEYSVTSIGNSAFWNCSRLTSITIEATTPPTLGTSVFELTMLAAIYIPDNTLSAYKEAWGTDYIFVNSENTLTIHIETPGTLADKIFDAGQRPAFVTTLTVTGTLNDDDFTCMRETMTSLVDIDLSGITNTTGVNFNGKSKLHKILLPENLTSIGSFAFYGCSLTSITIPNSVSSIGERAFCYCSSLTSISIPNSVTSVGDQTFSDCSSLTSITIPNSVTSIGKWAFSSCSSLTSISIPNSVTYIDGSAFSGCSSLTSITIPNSVTSIGYWAFNGCSSLTSITIPNSVTSIGNSAFSGCSSLTSITCLGSTPPEASDLSANTSTCTLTVPKEAYSNYLRHTYWGQFLTIRTIGDKEIKTAVNNSAWGKVTGAGVYNENEEATLTAIANSGYRFVKWSDEVTDNPRTIVVTQDSTFTAIFKANSFAISTMVNDDAMGSVTEGGEYTHGTEITLTATPNYGYRFTQWSDGNTDNPRTVVVTQDSTFTAIFEPNTFAITTAVNDDAMGSVSEGGEYAYGTEITLTATANKGYRFAQWSDGNTDNPRIITVTENKTYTAEFEVETFTITTASEAPSMGGVKVTLTAEPIEGFEFVEWTDGNTDNPRILTLTENIEVYARFQMAQGENPVDLETSKISSANIYTTNGTLHIEGATENYHILDAAGRLIYSGNASTLTLPRGIYLVTMGGEVEKIVL